MKIADNTVVTIEYTMYDESSVVLDSKDAEDPLIYLHGHANIIPGLENALTSLSPGDEIKVKINREEGWGDRVDFAIRHVPISELGGIIPQLGLRLSAETGNGRILCRIAAIGEDFVVLDSNHPFADKELVYHVKVRDVRNATREEIQRGVPEGDTLWRAADLDSIF